MAPLEVCAADPSNEEVVESMGNFIDKHASPRRGLSPGGPIYSREAHTVRTLERPASAPRIFVPHLLPEHSLQRRWATGLELREQNAARGQAQVTTIGGGDLAGALSATDPLNRRRHTDIRAGHTGMRLATRV